MTMFTANDDNSMYPKCPRVEIIPLATSISMRTPSNGTSNVGGLRYTSISITMMRMIVTIVTLFRLALAMLNVSDASGAAPLTKTFSPGGGLSLATMSRTASTDSLASIWPMSPARRNSTYVHLPSTLCAPAAVNGLPQRSITYCTCFLSPWKRFIKSS